MVIRLAKQLGYLVYHTHDSRSNHWATDAGYPDLHLVHERRRRSIHAELKGDSEYGKRGPAPEQVRWINALLAAGLEAYVWYPRDINDIVTILSRRN